jgi:hypothetical protein
MRTRREIIRSVAAGAAVIYPLPAQTIQPKTIDLCRRQAGDLADTMAILAGGQWRVSVDEKLEFVLITKVL